MAEKMGGYIAKYGFSCLEKNMTRFEAERAFQLAPAPPEGGQYQRVHCAGKPGAESSVSLFLPAPH